MKRRYESRRKKIELDSQSSESESISEESEFVPSDDEESTADEDENSEHSGESGEEEKSKDNHGNRVKMLQALTTAAAHESGKKKTVSYSDFHLNTDEYFLSQSARLLTSEHTLSRKGLSDFNKEISEDISRNISQVSRGHAQAIGGLTKNSRSSFTMWYHVMEEGYSLLLHGLGSKRDLMNDFYLEIVADHPALVVNGFFPNLSAKEILDSIIIEILGLDCPTNFNEALSLIEETLRKHSEDRLYLLIHNIDLAISRSNKLVDVFSSLAAIPNVRLLASADHINAPLIWDNLKRSRFNFFWFDATTFLPYEAENSYESSLLVQRSGTLALSSLHNVFQSLTTNTKAIYTLLVMHQLENGQNQNYPGMAFKDLYRSAREGFLVSSDLALRAQLTEFIDHKLVRAKRNMDGAEYLIIPLDNHLLQQFINQKDEI